MAARHDRAPGERKRGVGSNEVQHECRAPAAELRPDVGRIKAVGVERDRGAGVERQTARPLTQIDRDDPRRRKLAQELDSHVPEAAHADHEDLRPRHESR